MNQASPLLAAHKTLWPAYRSNLPRHLIGVSRHVQSSLMHTLTNECGHIGLRLNFEPFITLVSEGGVRISEITETLEISKQAVNQSINQIEAAGYLTREPDPSDGRARRIVLTASGRELIRDGIRLSGNIQVELGNCIGRDKLAELTRILGHLYAALALPRARVSASQAVLAGFLPRISDWIMWRLMELTRYRGHPGLKMSFAQVLTLMGPEGGRIQQMSRINEVSKQAISAVAGELEVLGYLQRQTEPADARQVLLVLTPQGVRLLEDSVASVADLETALTALLGKESLSRLRSHAAGLYGALQLEQDVFATGGTGAESNLHALAGKLQRQLGGVSSRLLGRLLLNTKEATQ